MKIGAISFLNIGKYLVEYMNNVVNVRTNKSPEGAIAKSEIEQILLSAAPEAQKLLESHGVIIYDND